MGDRSVITDIFASYVSSEIWKSASFFLGILMDGELNTLSLFPAAVSVGVVTKLGLLEWETVCALRGLGNGAGLVSS